MSKQILQYSLAGLCVIGALCAVLLTLSARSMLNSQAELAQVAKQGHEENLKTLTAIKTVGYELGLAAAARGLQGSEALSSMDADSIVSESLATIKQQAPRLGQILESVDRKLKEEVFDRGGGPRVWREEERVEKKEEWKKDKKKKDDKRDYEKNEK